MLVSCIYTVSDFGFVAIFLLIFAVYPSFCECFSCCINVTILSTLSLSPVHGVDVVTCDAMSKRKCLYIRLVSIHTAGYNCVITTIYARLGLGLDLGLGLTFRSEGLYHMAGWPRRSVKPVTQLALFLV